MANENQKDPAKENSSDEKEENKIGSNSEDSSQEEDTSKKNPEESSEGKDESKESLEELEDRIKTLEKELEEKSRIEKAYSESSTEAKRLKKKLDEKERLEKERDEKEKSSSDENSDEPKQPIDKVEIAKLVKNIMKEENETKKQSERKYNETKEVYPELENREFKHLVADKMAAKGIGIEKACEEVKQTVSKFTSGKEKPFIESGRGKSATQSSKSEADKIRESLSNDTSSNSPFPGLGA